MIIIMIICKFAKSSTSLVYSFIGCYSCFKINYTPVKHQDIENVDSSLIFVNTARGNALLIMRYIIMVLFAVKNNIMRYISISGNITCITLQWKVTHY